MTVSPAMTVREEGDREMVAGSVISGNVHIMYSSVIRSIIYSDTRFGKMCE